MLLSQQLLTILLLDSVLAWSPTDSYAPGNVSCPNTTLLRNGSYLSDDELNWLKKRDVNTNNALNKFLNHHIKNFSNSSIFKKFLNFNNTEKKSRIAIAASGGGYRAMLNGAGVIAAFDNRTNGSWEHGLGGLLESSTYWGGLSGGSWMLNTLAWNNYTSVQTILNNFTGKDDKYTIWDLDNSLFFQGGFNVFKTGNIWNEISNAIDDKRDAHFNVSLTDAWGRALSYQFWPSLKEGGLAYTYSTLRDVDVFKNASMPFPVVVADGRYPGTYIIADNATVFEFNPFEFGSWDPTLRTFMDIKYLGTNMTNGKSNGTCIAGFENVGFITGTSSSLFNQFILQLNTTNIPKTIQKIFNHILEDWSQDENDIAVYEPNPFYQSHYSNHSYSNALSNSKQLFLVDGGEDLENIPFIPFLQQSRQIDTIFAIDSSADTNQSWPNGTSLDATFHRQFTKQGFNISFPYVPDTDTMVNLGLNKRPTFFGCNASNSTNLSHIPPLIIYLPNTNNSFASNTSTFKMSYDKKERISMIRNGFESATRKNMTQDPQFGGCIACAIVRRQQERENWEWPDECKKCFERYCWNGKIDNKNITNIPKPNITTESGVLSSLTKSITKTKKNNNKSKTSSASASASASSTDGGFFDNFF